MIEHHQASYIKILKQFSILLSVLILPYSAKAQPRESVNYSFSSASPVVTQIIGWHFNENTGLWVSKKNSINDERRGKGDVWDINNVQTLQIKNTKIEGDSYSFLSFKQICHWYDYPAIEEGIHYYNRYWWYYLDDNALSSMRDLKVGETKLVNFTWGIQQNPRLVKMTESGIIGYFVKQHIKGLEPSEISNFGLSQDIREKQGFESSKKNFMIVRREDESTIRFYISELYFAVYDQSLVNPFKTNYYELSYNEWMKLFNQK